MLTTSVTGEKRLPAGPMRVQIIREFEASCAADDWHVDVLEIFLALDEVHARVTRKRFVDVQVAEKFGLDLNSKPYNIVYPQDAYMRVSEFSPAAQRWLATL